MLLKRERERERERESEREIERELGMQTVFMGYLSLSARAIELHSDNVARWFKSNFVMRHIIF
jgi:hypothetical protein